MYKNIIFDLGGVVVDFGPRGFLLERFCNESTENKLYGLTFGSPLWQQLDAGTVPQDEAERQVMELVASLAHVHSRERESRIEPLAYAERNDGIDAQMTVHVPVEGLVYECRTV